MQNIHPTSVVEDGASIAEDVKIGPFCYITKDVTIDSGTIVDSHVSIEGDTHIGKNNHIFAHCSIGSIPQDLKYAGEPVKLKIGDDNTIREFAQINPGTKGGGSITNIGNKNLIMGHVHIGHDVQIGNNCILANGIALAGHVEMGDFVVIGGLSAVHQFSKLGDYSMLGGASALSQDIPPYCMAEGNRAILRGLNLTGLRRLIDRKDIDILKSAYRELFEKGKPLQDVANELQSKSDSDFVLKLTNFIKKSKRGIPFARKINV
ncbi:Acyl-[acyl-carrier-protein]--UDP-N-acetylglucosamine O-acyltransferase [hydrothermal vent metagenome]|uniref:Acyl-[acyl-carrier-protein]--UDP-N-acetylglucosamine O-acyltransferase n=1 Tax=hydrothermal vent metagenome TaxID=652676 RepID=A0A1W1CD43_9ZZZZ